MRYCPKSDIRNITKTLNNGDKIKYLASTPKDRESNPRREFNLNSDHMNDALGSVYREFLVDEIYNNNMHRPQYNVRRNRKK